MIPNAQRDRMTDDEVDAAFSYDSNYDERTRVRDELIDLFMATAALGPAGLDNFLPMTIRFNDTPDNASDTIWRNVFCEKTLRYFLKTVAETRESEEPLVALLVASSDSLLCVRDIYMRRIAREYAESETDGLLEIGWGAEL